MRSEPFFVLILHDTAYSFPGSAANGLKGGESSDSTSRSLSGTVWNSTPA